MLPALAELLAAAPLRVWELHRLGEEQRNELEALESICLDSITVLSEKPPGFTITVTSEAGENDETVRTALKFTYSEKYPDEAPLYEIFSQENLDDIDVSDI